MILKFHGEVKNGKFKPDIPEAFRDSFLEHEGKRVTLTVGRQKKQRTLPQNSYLHGVVIKMLSDHLGYDPKEMKGIVKYIFNVKHTSDLSTVEDEELCERVRRWAAQEFNLVIPDPNQAD